MKRILVPTDFSPIADNAMNYAIEIAAKFKSELYLYHVYKINTVNYNWNYPKDEQPYAQELLRKMNRTKSLFMEKATKKGLSIQTRVEQDDIILLFEKKVTKHNIDLIVMGSKGASGLEKVIFGSVAATAIEWSKVPVLVVPPNYAFRPLKNIVLAIDDGDITEDMLSPIQQLASVFAAKITLLTVHTESREFANQIDNISFEGIETAYHEIPKSGTINQSIDKFIKKEECDLLCMIRRKKGFLKSIFSKSITKTQAYNSPVPLLVLLEN